MTTTQDSNGTVKSGKANLLVLDDEISVRKLLVRLLTKLDYNVHETATIDEAYVVAHSVERLDVWVTDAHVENRDASLEVERFRELHPHLAVVLVSGCEPNCDRADILEELGVVFLAKPFSPADLIGAVDNALRHGLASSTTVPLNVALGAAQTIP